jgi:uncharacterized protein
MQQNDLATFPATSELRVLRDPVWGTIRLDIAALRIVDSRAYQRLRNIRQLGLAYLVYPGATHSRFSHALGVYHLARRAVAMLLETGQIHHDEIADAQLVPYAALLHDVGHYPYAHILEEVDSDHMPGAHEQVAARFLAEDDIRGVLEDLGADACQRIHALICGHSYSPLRGLVAGDLDLDKIDYLKRDAFFCGVPYGEVDVDRLIYSLRILRDPHTGAAEIGIHEKGISALESLLFAKYQMFRNVYWHHAVRAGSILYQRMVQKSVELSLINAHELTMESDDGLLTLLQQRVTARRGEDAVQRIEAWLSAVRDRRLPKRALEIPAAALRGCASESWLPGDPELRAALESRLAVELGVEQGSVFLDYPTRERLLETDLLVLSSSGTILRSSQEGHPALLDLRRLADELYYTARAFRVFTVERREVDAARMLALLSLTAGELRARLEEAGPLL